MTGAVLGLQAHRRRAAVQVRLMLLLALPEVTFHVLVFSCFLVLSVLVALPPLW